MHYAIYGGLPFCKSIQVDYDHQNKIGILDPLNIFNALRQLASFSSILCIMSTQCLKPLVELTNFVSLSFKLLIVA